jgi:hypothetical protein
MKPTTQLDHTQDARRTFPVTDFNFQPGKDQKIATGRQVAKPTGFHKLSSDFLGTEAARDYVVEFSVFTVIALLCAWPILSSIIAMFRMIRGY